MPEVLLDLTLVATEEMSGQETLVKTFLGEVQADEAAAGPPMARRRWLYGETGDGGTPREVRVTGCGSRRIFGLTVQQDGKLRFRVVTDPTTHEADSCRLTWDWDRQPNILERDWRWFAETINLYEPAEKKRSRKSAPATPPAPAEGGGSG